MCIYSQKRVDEKHLRRDCLVILLRQSPIICRLQQVIQQVHTLDLLLQIGATIDIECERYIFMSQYLGKRFYIEFGNFNGADSKGMPYLMEFDFLESVPLEKARKELPICTRFCWLCFPCQEVMIRVFCVELLDDIHE